MTTDSAAGDPSGLAIQHADGPSGGAFFIEDGGERVAEMTYVRTAPGRAVIDHTKVTDRLGGRGIAKRLVMAGVAWARASGTRLSATCSYARAVFEKDASVRDVLA